MRTWPSPSPTSATSWKAAGSSWKAIPRSCAATRTSASSTWAGARRRRATRRSSRTAAGSAGCRDPRSAEPVPVSQRDATPFEFHVQVRCVTHVLIDHRCRVRTVQRETVDVVDHIAAPEPERCVDRIGSDSDKPQSVALAVPERRLDPRLPSQVIYVGRPRVCGGADCVLGLRDARDPELAYRAFCNIVEDVGSELDVEQGTLDARFSPRGKGFGNPR